MIKQNPVSFQTMQRVQGMIADFGCHDVHGLRAYFEEEKAILARLLDSVQRDHSVFVRAVVRFSLLEGVLRDVKEAIMEDVREGPEADLAEEFGALTVGSVDEMEH